ncbi:MAG: hypothetical protein ACXAAQ_12960, partial [Candidatus Thorarchaeota archaeon]
MNRTSKLFALLVVTMMFVGASQTHMQASFASHETLIIPMENFVFTGYDSPNITVVHNSPVNGSTQTVDFNINVDITSDFGPLNLTLFIDDVVDSNNNLTTIGTGNQDIAVDVDVLPEGMLNFTLFFEYLAEKETVYLLYFIDNDGVDFEFALYTPANGSELSG